MVNTEHQYSICSYTLTQHSTVHRTLSSSQSINLPEHFRTILEYRCQRSGPGIYSVYYNCTVLPSPEQSGEQRKSVRVDNVVGGDLICNTSKSCAVYPCHWAVRSSACSALRRPRVGFRKLQLASRFVFIISNKEFKLKFVWSQAQLGIM